MSAAVLEALWAAGEARFAAELGFLFEHSPWVTARAYREGPFSDPAALIAACGSVLKAASDAERLALIRAHPEPAGKAFIAGTLTASSAAEQTSAGLDRLTPEAFERFHALNAAYRERFDFPFIICVRLNDTESIFAALEARARNTREAEVAAALVEIRHIARLRLDDYLTARSGQDAS